MKKSVKSVTVSAIIAAAYTVLCLPTASFSFGVVQFRAAELLTLLPFLSPHAIYGVFVGCFLSNILFSTPIDAIVGSLATLTAAILTYKSKNIYIASVWPIVINALAIGTMLCALNGNFSIPVLISFIASIGISQFIVCFVLGIPFIKLLQRYKIDKYIV